MPETASARQSSRVSALLRGILPEFLSFKRDSKVERNLRYVLFTQNNLPLVLAQDLDPERKALQLLHQHSERLRDAGLERVVALDDRLVCLHAADDVVRLDGQDLLQNVGGAVRLERPHLHLSEPLAAELRLATERLLGHEAVGSGRASVDLVLDQVSKLQHVDHPNRDRLVKLLAGPAVTQANLAVRRQACLLQLTDDGGHRRAVEDGRGDLDAQRVRHPTQVGLEDLAQVHAARHAERVQNDVDRCAVRQVRHVLRRHDPGDDALVAVAACHLVPGRDLSLLSDVDPDHLVDAWPELVLVLAGEDLDVDHDSALAVRHAQARVAHLARLLSENRAEQALLSRQLGLALRRDLAHQDVALLDLGADVHDPALVEVAQRVVRDVGDVARDLFGTELRFARLGLVLLDVDRGVQVFFHHPLREQDRVLEVVTLPWHEGDEHVAAESHLAVVDRGTVRQDVALVDVLAGLDDRPVVEARALVGAGELLKGVVALRSTAVRLDHDLEHGRGVHRLELLGVRDIGDRAGDVRDDHLARVLGRVVLHAGADQRRVGDEQGHGLALHVRAHQGAAGVVVLEERDHGRGDRDDLLRRHVHVLDVLDLFDLEVAARPRRHALVDEVALRRQRGIRLGDAEHVLLVGGQVLDLSRDPGHDVDRGHTRLDQLLDRFVVQHLVRGQHLVALRVRRRAAQRAAHELRRDFVVQRHTVVDAAERGLYEAELVHLGVGGQVADEADVRTFPGLDRADAAVVAVVHVADVESGALARETTGAQRRETPLVRQLGQRVVLVHELRQLAGAEELLDRRDHRTRVDQRRRGDRVRITDRHALFDDSLHADEAHAELVLQQLADRPHPTVAEVVDVVRDLLLARRVVELDQLAQESDEVSLLEDAQLTLPDTLEDVLLVTAQALVDLVPADAAEVEPARVEEQRLEQVARVVYGRRVAGADTTVQLEECVLDLVRGVLVQRRLHVVVLGVVVDVAEHLQQRALLGLAVVLGALQLGQLECLEKHGHRDLALAVDLDRQQVLGRGLDLQPRAAVGDELGAEQLATRVRVLGRGEVHAGRAHQLRYDDALGAVDDEGPLVGHHGEVAHVDLGLLDLPRLLNSESGPDSQRRGVCHVAVAALFDRELRLPEFVVEELQLEVLAGVVGDGVDFVEQLAQAI